MDQDFALNTLKTLIRGGMPPNEACAAISRMFPADVTIAERVLKTYQESVKGIVGIDKPRTLRRDGAIPGWYAGGSSSDRYWPALKKHLLAKNPTDESWKDAVESVDKSSSKIVGLLEHPGVGEFKVKGLVLGYVQSGKTANFSAVIAKAADAGYKLIIVLSGLHNSLRNQTQDRLDEELYSLNPAEWVELTNANEDFRENGNVEAFLADNNRPRILCVIKKNASRLRRLETWLRRASQLTLRQCPTLIIDDEADQASVNTQDVENRTKVNSRIINIINLLPRVAYIGYTATPFANVFIDPSIPEDLYPRDFIVDLPRPEEYFGPEKVFGRDRLSNDESDEKLDGLDMIRIIDDSEVAMLKPPSRDERFDFEPEITPSLAKALRYFWMSTAVREVRGHTGQKQHSSMLIHTTLYADVHAKFVAPINKIKQEILAAVNSKNAAVLTELKQQWDEERAKVPPAGTETPVEFEKLLPKLQVVLSATEIIVENSRSVLRLNYREDRRKLVIVVGGNTLSRGLTLEGLVVSFFIRTSSAYDTLLQMGRWFGYRPGYSDLPRIWMTKELNGYFHDLATVEQEIRYDIEVYEAEHKTPLDFGIRVRTHPQMAITSALKMGKAIDCEVSYKDERLQTINFKNRDAHWLGQNLKATKNLITSLIANGKAPKEIDKSRHLFTDVSAARVVEFIRSYNFHPNSRHLRADLITEYIQGENDEGFLKSWNVVVMSQEHDTTGPIDLGFGNVPLITRSRLAHVIDHADIKALMSQIDWAADADLPSRELQSKSVAELKQLRQEHGRGALLIYPISKNSKPSGTKNTRIPMDAVEDVIGVGLVFPGVGRDRPVKYKTVDLTGIAQEELEVDEATRNQLELDDEPEQGVA
jgi:hypothetical protein